MKTNNKGFTLVELSIVLVIIGLLIGGILVAQSMINTAKIQALTRQVGQFDAAVANFQTKFNQLPGDDNLFGASASTTANDGQITDSAATGCAAGTLFNKEIGKFWFDLSQSGLSAQGGAAYGDDSAGGTVVTVNTNIPLAAAGTNAGFVTCYAATFVSGNWYMLGQWSAGNNTTALATALAFKPADVLALDTKLDDGSATGGTVRAVDALTAAQTLAAGSTTTKCQSTTAGAYDVANTTNVCDIAIRMGTSTGVLQ